MNDLVLVPPADGTSTRPREDEDADGPPDTAALLDVTLTGPSSRDGHLLATMIVGAGRRHGREIGRP